MTRAARFLITAAAVTVWTLAGLILLGCVIGLAEIAAR